MAFNFEKIIIKIRLQNSRKFSERYDEIFKIKIRGNGQIYYYVTNEISCMTDQQ